MNVALLTEFVARKQYVVRDVLCRSGILLACLLLVLASVPLGLLKSPEKVFAYSGAGTGTAGDPYIVTSCAELQSIGSEPDTNGIYYELTGDIDCSVTSGWNSGSGFSPIENFQGNFNGNNHTIDSLFINRPTENRIGKK